MKRKRIGHKNGIYSVRRRCKSCKKLMGKGAGHHYHNKVQIGRLTTSKKRSK